MSANKTFFHGSDIENVAVKYGLNQADILNFASNVNPLGISQKALQAFNELPQIMATYPDRDYTSLRQHLSSFLSVDKEFITVGNGSTELISLLIELKKPKNAVVIRPTYSEYERELALVGASIIPYYLQEKDDFKLNVADFMSFLPDTTEMVILCNPNNPTSSALLDSSLEEMIAGCKKRGIFLLIDETYMEFAPKEIKSALPFVKAYDNFVVIRGISKFFSSPGLRFGYGITSNQVFLEHLKKFQNPWSLNHVAAFLGEKMLEDVDYIKETKDLIEKERRHINDALVKIANLKYYPSYGNFYLVKLEKPGITASDFFTLAIKESLMIRDCSLMAGLKGEFIRFGILLPTHNQKLLDLLSKTFS